MNIDKPEAVRAGSTMRGVTAAHARDFKLVPQGAQECDSAFRHRVAGALRDRGHLIEAHEAQQDRRYDDPDGDVDVLAGVTGALAQAQQGIDYHVRGEQQVGSDIAAGALIRYGPTRQEREDEVSALTTMLAMGVDPAVLCGGRR